MDAFHIVVVRKAVQTAAVDSVLHEPVQRMGDLKIVVVIVPAVERLVQGIVRHRVQHLRVDPALVFPVDHFPHEPEFGLDRVRQSAQRTHEVKIQNIGRVQAQPVDVELRDPPAYRVQMIVDHLRIAQVELRQQIIPAPVVIGKPVVILVVVPKIDAAVPVPIG